MTDVDALTLRIGRDPVLRLVISGVAVLDGMPDPGRLRERVERTSLLLPRLRQRVVAAPLSLAPPRFLVAADFDVDDHLAFERAPGAGTFTDALRRAEEIALEPFPPGRPLWRLTALDGLDDGRAVVLIKIHHALTDGIGAIQLLLVLLDLEPDPVLGPLPDAPVGEHTSASAQLVEALAHQGRALAGVGRRLGRLPQLVARDPLGAASRFAGKVVATARLLNPTFRARSPLMRSRSTGRHFAAITVPVVELKAAARLVDGRLNDAFVAGIAGGLGRYHRRHDCNIGSLRMTMPINTREGDAGTVAGNQYAPARMLVPVAIEDPLERMRAVRLLVIGSRGDAATGVVDGIAGVLNRLPARLGPELYGRILKGVDFLASNVPGVTESVYLAGREVVEFFAFGPVGGSALNVTLLSYGSACHLGAAIDRAAVPDPEVLVACLVEGLDEVRALAASTA